ncbi:MAG TPA: dipeptide ABC transporter ATP-binding protein [Devosiaceae bacterium]|jgi:oligopeptide/dipeptide ABC transporter ATP-binding protein
MNSEKPILEVQGLGKVFQLQAGLFGGLGASLTAVQNVSFSVKRGEILALVGESGSGKTTTGRLILRLLEPTTGSVKFDGVELLPLGKQAMRAYRRRMQIVFQDPYSSLNPYARIGDVLEEPLIIHGLHGGRAERRERVKELMAMVGLSPGQAERFPHEFSGGQRQRIGIARALAVEPEFVVADEPVSALDVSVQAQIINLLEQLQDELRLAMLFIAHDLAIVRHIANHVAVMYLGRIVETAPTRQIFMTPRHPYTEALLSAAPNPDPEIRHQRIVLQGDIPSPLNPPSGCPFRTRCRHAKPECAEADMQLRQVGSNHASACIRVDELYGTDITPETIRADSA